MIKGFKIRIYPTKEQEELIWKHIHASRFIWNYMLDLQEKNYDDGGKFISAFSMNKLLTPLKKREEYVWLNDVSTTMLQRTCADLAEAYNKYFKKIVNHPRYKSRKTAKKAFPVCCNRFSFNGNIAHIQKLGYVKFKSDFVFPQGCGHKFLDVRLSYINGKYMLSFSMECENQAPQLIEESMGIDLGIKELAVVACGDRQLVFHNINKSKKMRDLEKREKSVQRRISRKYEASKRRTGRYEKTENIKKEEAKLKKICKRKADIRKNYIHQTTHTLVTMLPKRVVMEDLNVSGMMKNKHLSKAVQEQCFYEFIKQMRYKCEWSGIEFMQVDRFYPSSKTCSCCGAIKRDLKLSDRAYVCPECGYTIDRDLNAAINLSKYTASSTRAVA